MTEEIKIRKATRDDASAIFDVMKKSAWELCKDYYSSKLLHRWLDRGTPENLFSQIDKNIYFVAIENSVIVGVGGAVPGEIWVIYVLPSHIKSGIGSMLLSHAMEIALIDNTKVTVESTLNASSWSIHMICPLVAFIGRIYSNETSLIAGCLI